MEGGAKVIPYFVTGPPRTHFQESRRVFSPTQQLSTSPAPPPSLLFGRQGKRDDEDTGQTGRKKDERDRGTRGPCDRRRRRLYRSGWECNLGTDTGRTDVPNKGVEGVRNRVYSGRVTTRKILTWEKEVRT